MIDFRGYQILTATPADAAELAAHVNAGYRGDSSRAGWTTEADLVGGTRTDPVQLREEMATPGSRFEIMRDAEGKIVGSVHLVRETSSEVEKVRGFSASGLVRDAAIIPPAVAGCYLGMLTVRPTLQGAGIGKLFLAHAEKVAREWGCARIRMTVIDRRVELLAYYERRGYVRTGAEHPFHFDDPRFGVALLELRMVELEKKLD